MRPSLVASQFRMIYTNVLNATKLIALYKRDQLSLSKWMTYRAKELNRSMRSMLRAGKRVSKCYEWKSNNAQYTIILSAIGKKFWFTPLIMERGDRVQYIMMSAKSDSSEDALIALSAHFLHRYAQRAIHNETLSYNAILAHYGNVVRAVTYVYKDEQANRYVYAVRNGLILAQFDPVRSLMHFRTFVSTDMLKQLQKDSRSKVMHILDKMEETIDAYYGRAEWDTQQGDILDSISMQYLLDEQSAVELYGTYFND